MNWNQEWNYEANGNGWNDGRSGGLRAFPTAIPPRSKSNVIARSIIAVLLVAGAVGGAFQAFRCVRVVAHVVMRPHAATTPRSDKEATPDRQGSPSSRLTHHRHSTPR